VIRAYLSGGAGNADPAASLGGAVSVSPVIQASVDWGPVATPITGVTLLEVFGCADSVESSPYNASLTLYYNGDGPSWQLAFKPTGTVASLDPSGGNLLDVTAGGLVNLPWVDADNGILASLTVNVVPASLPTAGRSEYLTTSNTATRGNLFADGTVQDAQQGRVSYRCVYLKNTYASAKTLAVYVHQQPAGSDKVDIGLDPVGVNGQATSIASQTEAPVGVTFTRPDSAAEGLAVSLAANDVQALWIRQTIPAMSPVGGDPETFVLVFETL
jgi:hypothetical protein